MILSGLDFKKTGAYFLLILTTFFWGITFVVVKDAISHVNVFVFLAQRFLLATGLLIMVWPFLRRSLNFRTIIKGLILGVMLFGGFAFQTMALSYTSASNTAFLTGLNVVFVPLLSFIIFRKPVAKKTIVGALLAFAGLYLLCATGANWALNKGDMLGFACAVCIAIHIIYTGKYARECDIYWLTTIQLGVIGGLSLAASFFSGQQVFVWHPEIKNALIICVLFATIFAFLVQTGMQQYISPSSTALIFCLEPVFAAVSAFFLIDENIGLQGLAGAFLILSGMVLSELKLNSLRKRDR